MFDFFQHIIDWFNNIPTLLYDVFIWVQAWIVIWKMKAMASMALMTWEIAEQVLAQLNISDLIETAWGNIDSRTLQTFTFFRIPEALNIILNASVTKFIMRMSGFGR